MTPNPTLATGATGKIQSRVPSRLKAAGPVGRSGSRKTLALFEQDNTSMCDRALGGLGASSVNGHPDFAAPCAIESLANRLSAAAIIGAERSIMLTGRGKTYAHLGEERIARSGLEYTIVRSVWFAQSFSDGPLCDPDVAGVLAMTGGENEEPTIDVDDQADVRVEARTGSGHTGQGYDYTGPRLLNVAGVPDILLGAMGRRADHEPVSFDVFNASPKGGEPFVDIVTAHTREPVGGRAATPGDGVARTIGCRARDLTEFAKTAACAGKRAVAA